MNKMFKGSCSPGFLMLTVSVPVYFGSGTSSPLIEPKTAIGLKFYTGSYIYILYIYVCVLVNCAYDPLYKIFITEMFFKSIICRFLFLMFFVAPLMFKIIRQILALDKDNLIK